VVVSVEIANPVEAAITPVPSYLGFGLQLVAMVAPPA
jgi:hypothetical protein